MFICLLLLSEVKQQVSPELMIEVVSVCFLLSGSPHQVKANQLMFLKQNSDGPLEQSDPAL